MDAQAKEQALYLFGQGLIGKPLRAYYEARLNEVKDQLIACTGDTLTARLQGRALELQDLIKTIDSVRE